MMWLTREEREKLGRPFRLFLVSLSVLVAGAAAALLAAFSYDVYLSRQTARLLDEVRPFEPKGRNVPSGDRVRFFEEERSRFSVLTPRFSQADFRLTSQHPTGEAKDETPDALALQEQLFSLERKLQGDAARAQKGIPAAEGLANLTGASSDTRALGQLSYQLKLYEALAPRLIEMKQTEIKALTFQKPRIEPISEGAMGEQEVFAVGVEIVTTFTEWIRLLEALRSSPVLWRVGELEAKRLAGSNLLALKATLEATRF